MPSVVKFFQDNKWNRAAAYYGTTGSIRRKHVRVSPVKRMARFLKSLIAASFIAGCSESLSPEDFHGVWGDVGVKLTLSSTMARFETLCWAGDLATPVHVDGDRFTANGNLTSQGGAAGSETRAVILAGLLDDDALYVTVEPSFALGPYVLRRGVNPTIPGC